MGELAAVDASPLIFLAHARLLHFLRYAAPELVVPIPVAEEISRRGSKDPTAQALAETRWLRTVEAPVTPPNLQAWDLGPGESAVLAWCLGNPGSQAIVDDLAARRCAATLGVPVRGTLGLVLIAKQRGEISAARSVLEELRQAGMYLSDAVLNRALKRVGE